MPSTRLDQMIARCEGAYADITLRGYRYDLERFQAWCADRDLQWLPAEPATVAAFIDGQLEDLSIATVKRRLVAIRFAHRMVDLPSPTDSSTVYLAMRRAGRARRRRPDQALGLTSELLGRMVAACPDDLAGLRDAALLSVGYDTLCRSAELVAMRIEHLADDMTTICVPRSKADPFGDGRIAYLSEPTIARLEAWFDASGLIWGPLFRGLHCARPSKAPLHTASIRRIVKRAAQRAGLDKETVCRLSGHSMRVGAAQDMMVAGFDTIGIMQAGGWKNYEVVSRYVEMASARAMHERRWQRLGIIDRAA